MVKTKGKEMKNNTENARLWGTGTHKNIYTLVAAIITVCTSGIVTTLGMLAAMALLGGNIDNYGSYGVLAVLTLTVPMYFLTGKPLVEDQIRRTRHELTSGSIAGQKRQESTFLRNLSFGDEQI